jgi:hypothetical protein
MRRYIPVAFLAVLLLPACSGVTIGDAQVGPTRTEAINVPAPDSNTATVNLKFGASDSFQLRSGASALVEGSVRYNIDRLKPAVTTTGSAVTIDQGDRGLTLSNQVRNEWDLRLSNQVPLSLNVDAGAYKGSYELGGLRLRGLSVNQGAAESNYDFGSPNPEQMERLEFSSGAASVKLTNLANANASRMHFQIGAGEYTLDFGGTLSRSAKVEVDAGTSALTIRVPHGTSARVVVDGALVNVNADGFTKAGSGQYVNGAWDEAQPNVDITIKSAVGTIQLESN